MASNLQADIVAPNMTLEEATAAGLPPAGIGHDWMNYAIQPARPEYARALGISVTSFETWAHENLSEPLVSPN